MWNRSEEKNRKGFAKEIWTVNRKRSDVNTPTKTSENQSSRAATLEPSRREKGIGHVHEI